MNIYQKKTLLLLIGIFVFSFGRADEGQNLFKTTCAACHTIGKGRLVGPDLLNVSDKHSQEWLISFIKSSTAMVKRGDAEATAIFKEYNNLLMPDNSFSDAQITNIIAYIDQGGSGDSNAEVASVADILDGTTSENVSNGLLLFSGKKRLANGGAACTSCHKVRDERIFSSGTLAKDLSESYETMGSAGVAAIIKSSPFPVMNVAYEDHELTDDEIINLTAYLKSVSKERIYQRPTDFSLAFAFFGLVAFVAILLSTIILYFKRKKLAVNHHLLNKPSKVIN